MHITVKILGGSECTVEKPETSTVFDLKEDVAEKMQVPVDKQRLVYLGKPLADEKVLSECNLPQRVKLFLIVKKDSEDVSEEEPPRAKLDLSVELARVLKRHMKDSDSEMVIKQVIKDIDETVAEMNLDDIERLAKLSKPLLRK